MVEFSYPLILLLLFIPLSLFYPLGKKWKKYLLRILSACLIILALAGPKLGTTEVQQSVFFLVDRSPSVNLTEEETKLLDKIREISRANEGREFGVLSFSETANVEAPLEDELSELTGLDDEISGRKTDLNSAVEKALTELSGTGRAQLVLLSDGRINTGLDEAISKAKRKETPISTVPVGNWKIKLKEGTNTFKLRDKLTEGGRANYKAVVNGPEDRVSPNNSKSNTIEAKESPELLIVSRKAGPLTSILDRLGRNYELTDEIPSLKDLARYKEVVLTGIGLSEIPTSSIRTLKKYVEEMGGGLLVIQGRRELENLPGKDFEEMLPVTYKTPEIRKEPRMAVIYLLDTSASMEGRASGARKIELLKETAAASIELLDEKDLVGLISFDREFRWNAKLDQLKAGRKIYRGLRDLTASGGTDMYYPLKEAISRLEEIESRIKHILLVTDGKTMTEERDFPGLIAKLNRNDGITVSAIATGPSPEEKLLKRIVEAGGGKYYRALEYGDLPRISMEMTKRINRKRFLTGSFEVDGFLPGGKAERIPRVDGYVLTYPKKGARTPLSIEGDPLFSRWQYGLGKVAVLNTDLSGRWTENWMEWSRVGPFADKILDSVKPISTPSRYLFRARLQRKEGKEFLRVEARNPDGSYANLLDINYQNPAEGKEYQISQVAPGVYRTRIDPEEYVNRVLKVTDETRNKTLRLPLPEPYSKEYHELGTDKSKLREIADRTGGKFLEDEPLIPEVKRDPDTRDRKIHPELLLAGLSLFFADLIRRKFE